MLVLAAERRHCGKQPNGVVNRKVDKKHSDFSINLVGIMGEYAVARMLGINIDTSIALVGDDKVSDLQLNNKTIQVKSTIGNRDKCHLYFRRDDLFKADIGVLTAVTSPTDISILGWITREKFKQISDKVNFGESYVVGVISSKLDKPEYLKTYLETL